VSLGSSDRNHTAHATLLGREFEVERRGTDGDLKRAEALIRELDGQVAAIGLGGIDLYVVAAGRRYVLRDAARLAAAAQTTPVVDGSGLKDTLERETIRRLAGEGTVDFQGVRTLVVSAVDRFGMAEEIVRAGARTTFGDLLFILGVPTRLHSLAALDRLAKVILPVASRLPFKMLYPTGDKQRRIDAHSGQAKWMAENDIIAGDFLLIRRYLPADLSGKTIITNTTTAADIELLRDRGLKTLVTTTPEFKGRSFGTNVMEGVFAALGARTAEQYRDLLAQLDWKPRVVQF
jgi:hypothetical protein